MKYLKIIIIIGAILFVGIIAKLLIDKLSKEDNPEGNVRKPIYEEGVRKPVIYLYPEKEEYITVKLNYNGELTCTYPEYNNGWNVIAKPDGTLINVNDNKEYSYLFWEGLSEHKWNIDEGFVVKGEDTKEFLQDKLSFLGLSPKEYNEFIVYWLPRMQDNKYNLIHFSKKEYEDLAKLTIEPEPDSILRVFMVYRPLEKYIEIKEQELDKLERIGFNVVEWGGTEIN